MMYTEPLTQEILKVSWPDLFFLKWYLKASKGGSQWSSLHIEGFLK